MNDIELTLDDQTLPHVEYNCHEAIKHLIKLSEHLLDWNDVCRAQECLALTADLFDFYGDLRRVYIEFRNAGPQMEKEEINTPEEEKEEE